MASILRGCELAWLPRSRARTLLPILGRGQTFFDGVRDKPDRSRIHAIQIGKVQGGDVADHHEVHQCSEWRAALAADRMDRKFAAQIVRQPVHALADPRIFIPMAQQHRRIVLQGNFVAAIPGDGFVVAGVRLF